MNTGLENSTRLLVFTGASGCRVSKNFDISSEYFFLIYANTLCDAQQVPILRYFNALNCSYSLKPVFQISFNLVSN